jgi:hypothetical protein
MQEEKASIAMMDGYHTGCTSMLARKKSWQLHGKQYIC